MSMQSILSANASMDRIQMMQSVRTKTQGQINVLNAEIKTDGGNPRKEEQVHELEERSADLTGKFMGELNDVNETLNPDKEPVKPDDETTKTEKNPNTDKVELSKPSDESKENTANKIEVTEEVTSYDLAGKLIAAAPLIGNQIDARA